MIVDTSAYVFSFITVFMCFVIRDFLIPLLVWRKHLKNKSYSYRFWFCVITQAALQINLVLLLGFLDRCNPYTLLASHILIYGLILWNYSDKKLFHRCRELADELWSAYNTGRLLPAVFRRLREWIRGFPREVTALPLFQYIRSHLLEVILLTGLVIYNLWYLTHNVMRYHSYQFSDVPVHQSWIYDLEHGTLFSNGIYPFGMHAMIYVIRVVFRLNLREIMLYAGAYQTVLLMLGLYLLAREIFIAKYSPIAAVLIISLMLNQGRYAASLPQEAGMYTVVGLAYFMLRYLHRDREKFRMEGDSLLRRFSRVNAYISRRYINSEAILLMLCVALVIAYHFYTAITAIFMVMAIGLAYLPRILKKQYFVPLLYCGIMGAAIAILPIAACLAKGIPFQESMAWASSVIKNEEWKGSDTDYLDQLTKAQGAGSQEKGKQSDTEKEDNQSDSEKAKVKMDYSLMSGREILSYYYQAIFDFGFYSMFGESATRFMFLCMLLAFFSALVMLSRRKTRVFAYDYMALLLYMLIICTVGAAQTLGLVELIAAARASSFSEPFVGIIYMLPIDFAFRLLSAWKNRYYQALLNFLSLAVCCLAALLIVRMGWYHAFFDINQAYYNESEYLLRHIRHSFEKNTYTIVSPTEEYYDVVDHGRHTQLSKFVNMINGKEEVFTFPTQYVFFFIEKRVLQDDTYGPVMVDLSYAAKDFIYLASSQDYYFQRAIIESQAYYWAQKAMQVYPNHFKIYYEDDIYVAYLLEQNTFHPLNLQLDYLSDYIRESKEKGWATKESSQ